MADHRRVYRFAARVGALEGYVYQKPDLRADSLAPWIGHVVHEYNELPAEVRDEFQDLCDATVGRAIHSLAGHIAEDHPLLIQLKSITKGKLPNSADDFS